MNEPKQTHESSKISAPRLGVCMHQGACVSPEGHTHTMQTNFGPTVPPIRVHQGRSCGGGPQGRPQQQPEEAE